VTAGGVRFGRRRLFAAHIAVTLALVIASEIGAPAVEAQTPATGARAFAFSITAVTKNLVSHTWRPGCPVGPADLRVITLRYVGFDGSTHEGTIIVNQSVTTAVVAVFRRLFAARFPIRSMEPEDVFGGSDPKSMAADNTSGFNCRYAVAPGPKTWSVHAYGEAIDVNPVENPYIEGGVVQPAAGAQFRNRSDVRPGMAVPGGPLNNAFASVGWYWGGRWSGSPDYQHFSSTGG
jgi:hypothetical protein